jgi:glycosyltransferase involved in cell wall biosynthesis
MSVIYNSMGASLEKGGRSSQRNAGGQSWIVITRLISERRIADVFHAATFLRDMGRHVSLTVVGEGPQRRELEDLAHRLRLSVDFRGQIISHGKTAELLSGADILVSPGHVGLAAIHAMSNGCPVATHGDRFDQMPEAEAVIDGRTGVVFAKGNIEEMATRIWDFVANSSPAEVADACLREVIDRWTPMNQAKCFENAVVASRSGSGHTTGSGP